MGGFGSGGHNKKPISEHLLHHTFRADRHGPRLGSAPVPPVSNADRTRALAGLSVSGRRLAAALLDTFDGWTPATLTVLRSYVQSCDRVAALEAAPGDGRDLRAEIRSNLALLKALGLERAE